jgi:hypothetical protein
MVEEHICKGATGNQSAPETQICEEAKPLSGLALHSTESDAIVTPEHQLILTARAIVQFVVKGRGNVSAVDPKISRKLGFTGEDENLTGLLMPIWSVNGKIEGYQLKPDKPALDKKGKPKKYIFPSRRKQRAMLDVHPQHYSKLGNPKIPLLITESILKADSATSAWGAQLCIVAESGVYGFRGGNSSGGKTALSCW